MATNVDRKLKYGHVKFFCPNSTKTPKIPAVEYLHVNFVSAVSKGSAKFLKTIDVNDTNIPRNVSSIWEASVSLSQSTRPRPITPRVPNIYLATIGSERIPMTLST
jgi:hypothetical protein